jgi:hypothetical protein
MVGDMLEYSLLETYIEMMKISIIAGTGGLLSHAPRRGQALLVLTDAFQPEGVTKLYQDSVFMMPHLGVLSKAFPEIAWNIFDKDCLIRLGTVIAPAGAANMGEPVVDVKMEMPDGVIFQKELNFGEIVGVPLAERTSARATISPKHGFDVGAGPGRSLETVVEGGVVGVVVDARGRPLVLPENDEERRKSLRKWFDVLQLYPEGFAEDDLK